MSFLRPILSDNLKITALAAVISFSSFLIYCWFGIGLSDEGFVWYGMIQTSLGKVPIRDFQSYDPGRYYWGALWFKIFGNHGPIAFRASLALFEFIGLNFAILSLKRITASWYFLLFGGLIVSAWMYTHYKAFDITLSIAAVYFAIILLENPTKEKHLVCGMFVGFSALVGINHGLYNSISFFLIIIFIWFKFNDHRERDPRVLFKRFLLWSIGILLGYSPMLIMYSSIPEFLDAYLAWIKSIINNGTNIPLPIPWPWLIDYSALSMINGLRSFSERIYFFIFPVFETCSLLYLILSDSENAKRKHVLTATAFTGLTYIHYAFDRADLIHLSFAVIPLLIGLLSFWNSAKLDSVIKASKKFTTEKAKRIGIITFIFLTTYLSVGVYTPWNQAKIIIESLIDPNSGYITESVQGTKLWWTPEDAALVKFIKKANTRFAQEDGKIFLAPSWPGMYAILEKESPTKTIYFLFPKNLEQQVRVVEQLVQSKTKLAVIGSGFESSYAYVWHHLVTNFSELSELSEEERIPVGVKVMVR